MMDPGQGSVPESVDLSEGAGVVCALSSVLALGLSFLAVRIIFKEGLYVEVLSGWGLAFVNAVFAVVVNMLAVGRGRGGFMALGIGGNVLRAMGVLAIIFIVRLSDIVKFEPFISAFLAGYFVFMITETVRLNVVSLRKKSQA
jgi:hypothetical protein